MRFNLFYILSFLMVCSSINAQTAKAKKSEKFTVSGKVTQTQSYCGGAAPTEEILQQMRTPKPYAGKIFYVRKGNVNNLKSQIVLSFTVSATGEFSFDLPPGTYSIIQKEQVNAFKLSDYQIDAHHVADEKCLKDWWAKPYHVLEIKDKNITGLKFNFHQQCFINGDVPCIQYTGPMPP